MKGIEFIEITIYQQFTELFTELYLV